MTKANTIPREYAKPIVRTPSGQTQRVSVRRTDSIPTADVRQPKNVTNHIGGRGSATCVRIEERRHLRSSIRHARGEGCHDRRTASATNSTSQWARPLLSFCHLLSSLGCGCASARCTTGVTLVGCMSIASREERERAVSMDCDHSHLCMLR